MRWVFFILVLVLMFGSVSAPSDFPINQKVEIRKGADVAGELKDQKVIRSVALFKIISRVTGLSDDLKAGRYVFEHRADLLAVLLRVHNGDYGTIIRRITIPEGSSNAQISEIIGMEIGKDFQGYLFPDTYFFDQFFTLDEIIDTMISNFKTKVGEIDYRDLILASIVEEEASSRIDRKLIAGILQKRLKLSMPLQVDVAPETYDIIGLPERPIVNPGLDAINVVRFPTASKYLYYLSDESGVTHYAVTFEEHNANRKKYGI
ncbi:MAG: endolytic transglycosylase MltG [Patescibacteria group bacterium]